MQQNLNEPCIEIMCVNELTNDLVIFLAHINEKKKKHTPTHKHIGYIKIEEKKIK